MARKRLPNLNLENIEVLPGGFRNFSGRPDKYTREGDRSFNIIIGDEELAQQMIEDGWNVRILKPRAEDEAPRYRLAISVSFRELSGIPPMKIFMYSGHKRVQLTEETVGTLDWANFQTADITIRPRVWENDAGELKVKAYLQEMHVVVEEDRWAEKYRDYED